MKERLISDQFEHLPSCWFGELESSLIAKSTNGESLRRLSSIRQLDLRLPASLRLPGALHEMHARHTARVVRSLLPVELAVAQSLCRVDFLITPGNGSVPSPIGTA
jgi:hypothetical protein